MKKTVKFNIMIKVLVFISGIWLFILPLHIANIYIQTNNPFGIHNKILSFGLFFSDLELSEVSYEIQYNNILSTICVFLFTFGFALSFFYIKEEDHSFIRGSINLISISSIVFGGIGLIVNNESSLTYKEHPPIDVVVFQEVWKIEPVFYVIFLIVTLLLIEYIVLEQTTLLTRKDIAITHRNELKCCRSCGNEILDPNGEFCSKCGASIN